MGRRKLFDSSKVDRLVAKEDILFSSSSAVAGFILGCSVSGPKTLKIGKVIFSKKSKAIKPNNGIYSENLDKNLFLGIFYVL